MHSAVFAKALARDGGVIDAVSEVLLALDDGVVARLGIDPDVGTLD